MQCIRELLRALAVYSHPVLCLLKSRKCMEVSFMLKIICLIKVTLRVDGNLTIVHTENVILKVYWNIEKIYAFSEEKILEVFSDTENDIKTIIL